MRVPGATGVLAFDQRAHGGDVAQPDFADLAADRGDRPAHQPLARLADALIAVGLDGRRLASSRAASASPGLPKM